MNIFSNICKINKLLLLMNFQRYLNCYFTLHVVRFFTSNILIFWLINIRNDFSKRFVIFMNSIYFLGYAVGDLKCSDVIPTSIWLAVQVFKLSIILFTFKICFENKLCTVQFRYHQLVALVFLLNVYIFYKFYFFGLILN